MTTTAEGVRPAIAPSPAVARIEATSRRVQQPQSSGDLVSLAMGEPDFDTPERIVRAAAEAAASGRTHYSPLLGERALREGLAAGIASISGEEASSDDVLVTQGGTAGIAATILGLVGPGDRVVFPDPTYSLYADVVAMAGATAVRVPLQDDLHWDLGALADALRGSRLFVFCNPGNPTGIVHTRLELEVLAGLLEGTETLVLADEAYAALDFTGKPFPSVLTVPQLLPRTVYCQTFSKSYAMTGWRVGYLWGPSDAVAAAARVHNTFNGSVNTVVQDAALVAFEECADDVAAMRESYARRRELMRGELLRIDGLELSEPEGAFYFFPRYDLDLPATTLVGVLRENGVAVRPGSEFGPRGEGRIRLSYAASDEAIV